MNGTVTIYFANGQGSPFPNSTNIRVTEKVVVFDHLGQRYVFRKDEIAGYAIPLEGSDPRAQRSEVAS